MNPQSTFTSTKPCGKYGVAGELASMHRNEIRWSTLVNRPHTARTAGFVIG
ncbi:MAG TPA: hypothetical protein VM511_12520 [Luteolibacter sp.]|jgi:hypothetical protein|nr:hypothetical protein [Luteolibacter sp.]